LLGKSRLSVARSLFSLIIGFSLLGGLTIAPVSATNNQGLDWSIEIGSNLNYTFKCTTLVSSALPIGDYDLFFNITSLPLLEDNITSVDDFQLVYPYHYDMHFQNSTKLNSGLPDFIILPTENWTLMQTIWADEMYYSDSLMWINTTTEWGFMCEADGINDLRIKWRYIFSKANGLLLLHFVGDYKNNVQVDYVELRLDSYTSYPDLIEPIPSTNPTNTSTSTITDYSGFNLNLTLMITGSVAIIIVLVIVYFKKYAISDRV
jgi:hypothetical protein